MKLVFGLISVIVLIVLVAIVIQEFRYLSIRRNLAGDRQALFHSGEGIPRRQRLEAGSGSGVAERCPRLRRRGAERRR